MTKQTLLIEQMQHLKELGLEMKDTMLYWVVYKVGNEKNFVTTRENAMEVIDESCRMLPAYTLQDVLDALPENIYSEYIGWAKLELQAYSEDKWVAGYRYIDTCNRYIIYRDEKELIDAAYKMLCWAIENGYIETIRYESEN